MLVLGPILMTFTMGRFGQLQVIGTESREWFTRVCVRENEMLASGTKFGLCKMSKCRRSIIQQCFYR